MPRGARIKNLSVEEVNKKFRYLEAIVSSPVGNPNLNASLIVTGTLDDERLSANVPLLDIPNTFTENTTLGDVDADNITGTDIIATKYFVSSLNTAPATASSTGTAGEIRFTATHIYFCTTTNTWKRVAIATF